MTDLFDGLKRFVSEVESEVKHQVEHGASEGAAALFNGNAFVLYGHNQHPPTPEQQHDSQGQEAAELQRGNDGMEM